jgi:hypothetical protein
LPFEPRLLSDVLLPLPAAGKKTSLFVGCHLYDRKKESFFQEAIIGLSFFLQDIARKTDSLCIR